MTTRPTNSCSSRSQGDHSFSTIIFHDFFMTFPWPKNEFPWPIGTTYFFEINDTWFMNAYQSKNFPVARRDYCHKIKPQVYVYVFTSISVLQNNLSNTTSLTQSDHSFSTMIFHDFPWPWLFSMTFQAWKMVLLNSMTFRDFPGKVVTLSSSSCCCSSKIVSSSLITIIIIWLTVNNWWHHMWHHEPVINSRRMIKQQTK